jgi:DNA polymerase-3 subunit beta
MKVIVLKENLKKDLNLVEKITGKNLSLPILSNVLLKTNKNFLILSATNLEIGIICWNLSKIEKRGEITVPANLFSNYLNFLPNREILLETKDNILYVECENYKTEIKGLSSEEFPIIPKIENEEFSLQINSFPFCQGLSQVIDIVSFSQTRPELSGIYFSLQKNLLKLVATDGFRLAEKKLFFEKTIENLPEKEYSLILPQKMAREIINIFSEKNQKIKIYFSPNQILFEGFFSEINHPKIHLISRLIEGEYPKYQEIIPREYQTEVILSKDNFLNQIKTASLFCGKINEVKLIVDPIKKGIEIFSQSPEIGQNRSFLPTEIKGKNLEISFNYRFLMDGLLNIKSSEVIFKINQEEKPSLLKPVDDESYFYLIMPIRTV